MNFFRFRLFQNVQRHDNSFFDFKNNSFTNVEFYNLSDLSQLSNFTKLNINTRKKIHQLYYSNIYISFPSSNYFSYRIILLVKKKRGGLLFPYHVGTLAALSHHKYLTDDNPIAGSSAGSIAVVCKYISSVISIKKVPFSRLHF